MASTVGFIGLGRMGQPMALNLARAGQPLVVWNRSPERSAPLRAAGAHVAAEVDCVFDEARTIFLMLADEAATDAVLARRSLAFARRVSGNLVVNMGTVSPAYSMALAEDVRAAGGHFAEAPVSGSRQPAELGQLVAMVAGTPEALETVTPLLATMCRRTVPCGAVPSALLMKLALNVFLLDMVTGLVEAVHFARRNALDPASLLRVIEAGPMASAVALAKGGQLQREDFEPQASVDDALKNATLTLAQARASGTPAPLLAAAHALLDEAARQGHGRRDMVAMLRALEARAGRLVEPE
jgi:3-hydroxyisobutyrate dehydrogenase